MQLSGTGAVKLRRKADDLVNLDCHYDVETSSIPQRLAIVFPAGGTVNTEHGEQLRTDCTALCWELLAPLRALELRWAEQLGPGRGRYQGRGGKPPLSTLEGLKFPVSQAAPSGALPSIPGKRACVKSTAFSP